MTTDAVTPLRHRMIEDMNARKLCAGTQRGHIRSCKRFAAFVHRSPDTATTEDIRRFQLHLAEAGVSICNRNRIMTGLRFSLRVTLRRLDLANEVYHIGEPQKIPLVMSPDETRRLLAVAGSLKVRTFLRLGYGCSLRASEVVRLKVKHIDSAQHPDRAVQGQQGPQCHAVAEDARSAAPVVEGASVALRFQSPHTGTLAVSWQPTRQADDHPPVAPSVSPGARRGRDPEGRDAARVSPQLRHPPARELRTREQADHSAAALRSEPPL